jgi:CRISPR system Cascade subunit CasD
VRDFVRFTIFAPLASWGETAVGEIRGFWDRPSRSALLGLIAASLGIRRDEVDAHARLDAALGVAVRTLAAGRELSDYHTTQNPKSRFVRKHRPATRRVALELDEPETSLSRRWLRQDALYLAAVWARSDDISLKSIAQALEAPSFVLYAGRKANAFGLPLAPRVVQARSLADALRDDPRLPDSFALLRPRDGWGVEVAHDICDGFDHGLSGVRTMARRDASPNRDRWQFGNRIVYVGRIPAGAP